MQNTEFKALAEACRTILCLELPVNLRFRRGSTFTHPDGSQALAIYQHKGTWHKITLAAKISDPRGTWREILAHEFVHAYCEENHPKATHHGRTFQRMAAALRRELRGLGWGLKPLYLKGTDE